MPNESVNLFLSIQSGNSEHTLVSLSDKTRALDKETQLLRQAIEALAKANKPLMEEQTKLQVQLRLSQKIVNDLNKAYDQCGDELMELDLKRAIENHAKLKEELSEVNDQISANQKSYKGYLETIRKGELGKPSSGSLGDGNGGSNAVGVMAALGIGDKLSTIAQETGSALLDSALGGDIGGMVSGMLGNALTGAVAGSGIPGVGTALGAALGGTFGLISGGTKIFEAKDDAFKDYYGGLYDDVKGRSGEMVEEGSSIAGGREQTRMAFSQRLGGDDQAAVYLAQVEKMAASTNYEYDEIVGYAKLLLNSYAPDEVFEVLRDLSDATAGLDLSSSDVNMMISGLSRMRTTGKATQEYLNYFRERGVDVDQALADSLGVEKRSVSELVSKGKVSGEDAAQAVLDFIQREFGGLSDGLASTYDAMVDNLGDINASLQAAGGDAYNELRKEGIQEDLDAYGGELGDAIGEINAIMGENQARKENLQAQYMREVLDAVLNGNQGSLWSTLDESQQKALTEMSEQYASLMDRYQSGDTDAGAELESLYERAQALGQAYFDNSGLMETLNEVEREEIDAIREATTGLENAYTALYDLNQTMSKGLVLKIVKDNYGSTIAEGKGGDVSQLTTVGGHVGVAQEAQEGYYGYNGIWHPHAFGLARVPYDGYPALLHEGERVLTAAEARAQDGGRGSASPITISITGNSFTGAPEEMADQLAEILLRRLAQEAVAAAPK